MPLDRETIDVMSDVERTDLLALLEDMVKYLKLKLGVNDIQPTSRPVDTVGDVIIQGHKIQQEQAMRPRKRSGWTSIGMGKADDKHV